jgi:predicted nucleic acid-binding protein
VYSETSALVSVFPQKNGTEPLFPPHCNRELALERRVQVCKNPDDDIFIECADAARADYLITGNLQHFPAFWKSTKVITAREFVGLAAPHLIG